MKRRVDGFLKLTRRRLLLPMAGYRTLASQLFDKTRPPTHDTNDNMLSLNQRLELDPDLDEMMDDGELEKDASDAEKQVLVMSETIDLLRRHLESQRKELQAAYKTLREYEEKKNDEHAKALEHSSAHSSYEKDLRDLRFNLELKHVALHEATVEKEQTLLELHKYKALTRELSDKLDRLSNVQSMYHTSLNQASVASSTQSTQSSLAYVPKSERFDPAPAVDNGTDFWKTQWKEALKARKTAPVRSPMNSTMTHIHYTPEPSKAPSMKIFSSPPHGKRGYSDRDERIPAHRYIGLSSRQSQLVKECYKVVGNKS
ncbi:Aste57867_921 [Aphanomyces stellatus]|uniref:Aste57867_921 protein n=1 Tax=Aphanomyces stellatus TaxID=120398 RepID=A0A485K538_9STRA|nr:hypothetical protein As57867_000920 [Aphanomyces stellatus]VFT78145.1 Aste57867_921 [Aphanomyces stellatus]